MAKKLNSKIEIPLCLNGFSIGQGILVASTEIVAAEVLVKRNNGEGIQISQSGKGLRDRYTDTIKRSMSIAAELFGVEVENMDILVRQKVDKLEVFGGEASILIGLICSFCDIDRTGHTLIDVYNRLMEKEVLSEEEWCVGTALLFGGLRANHLPLELSNKVFLPPSLGLTIVVPDTIDFGDQEEPDASALAAMILSGTTGRVEDFIEILKHHDSEEVNQAYAKVQHDATNIAILVCPNTGIAQAVAEQLGEKYTCHVTTVRKQGLIAS